MVGEARDALGGTDWVAHWRGLVERRQADAEVRNAAQPGYWDRRAPGFKRSLETRPDPFLEFLEPWLGPHKTLIDAGAGYGRHAVPFASRLEWVTAVEPSDGMRALLRATDNMTVIASSWEDAEPQRADLVICCHVLYGVAEAVPFIQKLEASARERVFVVLRDCQPPRAEEAVIAALGGPRPRVPEFADLFLLLRQLGIRPEVHFMRYPSEVRYEDLDEVLE